MVVVRLGTVQEGRLVAGCRSFVMHVSIVQESAAKEVLEPEALMLLRPL
jgi:hypothetical protein